MESDYSLPEAVDAAVAVASKLINLNEEIANDIKEFNSKYKRLEGFEKIDSRDVANVGLHYYKNLLKIQDSVHRGLRDVGSSDDKRKTFTSENNDVIFVGRSKPSTIIGVLFFISSFLVAGIFSNNLWIPKFLIVLWLAACGWACLSRKKIKCACGFHGVPRGTSKRNGCIFFLLLCIGIVPGLIYYIVKPKRVECPWCGSPLR